MPDVQTLLATTPETARLVAYLYNLSISEA